MSVKVELTDEEYEQYLKFREDKKRKDLMGVLTGRLRAAGHHGFGISKLLMEIWPSTVLECILDNYNPMPQQARAAAVANGEDDL